MAEVEMKVNKKNTFQDFLGGKTNKKQSFKCILLPGLREEHEFIYHESFKQVQTALNKERLKSVTFKSETKLKKYRKKMKRTLYLSNITEIKNKKYYKNKCFEIKLRKKEEKTWYELSKDSYETCKFKELQKMNGKNVTIQEIFNLLMHQQVAEPKILYTKKVPVIDNTNLLKKRLKFLQEKRLKKMKKNTIKHDKNNDNNSKNGDKVKKPKIIAKVLSFLTKKRK